MKEFSNFSEIDSIIQDITSRFKMEIEKENDLLNELVELEQIKDGQGLEGNEIDIIDNEIISVKSGLNNVKGSVQSIEYEISSIIDKLNSVEDISKSNLDKFNEVIKIDQKGFSNTLISNEGSIINRLKDFIHQLETLKNEVSIQKQQIAYSIKQNRKTFRNSSKSYKFLKKTLKGVGKVLGKILTFAGKTVLFAGGVAISVLSGITTLAAKGISTGIGKLKESGVFRKTGGEIHRISQSKFGGYKIDGTNAEFENIKNIKFGSIFHDVKNGMIIKEKNWATHFNDKGIQHITIEKYPIGHKYRNYYIGKDWTIDNDLLEAKEVAPPGFFDLPADDELLKPQKPMSNSLRDVVSKSSKNITNKTSTELMKDYGLLDHSFNQKISNYNFKWNNEANVSLNKEKLSNYGFNTPEFINKSEEYAKKWMPPMNRNHAVPKDAYEYYTSIGAHDKAKDYINNKYKW